MPNLDRSFQFMFALVCRKVCSDLHYSQNLTKLYTNKSSYLYIVCHISLIQFPYSSVIQQPVHKASPGFATATVWPFISFPELTRPIAKRPLCWSKSKLLTIICKESVPPTFGGETCVVRKKWPEIFRISFTARWKCLGSLNQRFFTFAWAVISGEREIDDIRYSNILSMREVIYLRGRKAITVLLGLHYTKEYGQSKI